MCAFHPGAQERLISASGFDPVAALRSAVRKGPPWESIIDFATHSSFCGARLYPRQHTLLKLIFLETDHFTSYDLDVIEQWRNGFRRKKDVFGVQPDIWERVQYLKERGARRFPHIQFVGGRRGSKGKTGGILGAEQIAYFFSLDDWQAHYGVSPGKDGYLQIGATSQTQAKAQLFADVRSTVEECVYLQPHIAEAKDHILSVRTPADVRRIAEMKAAKVPLDHQVATLRAQALSASSAAGRGATAFGIMLDEFAFMVQTGSQKGDAAVYEDWHPSLDQFDLDGLTYIPSSPWQRTGKAQPLDAKILTSTGWRRMGDLTVGDQVIGSTGRPVTVTAIHPQGVRPVYRVTTGDGAAVEAADNHLWTVQTRHDRRRGACRTLTTEELAATTGHVDRWVSIPRLSAPVQHPRRDLPLDPYALGLLLGDGCITSAIIFGSRDPELVASFGEIMARDFPDHRLVRVQRNGGYVEGRLRSNTPGVKGKVRKELENLGLWGLKSHDKFVPDEYLRGSPEQRLELLRGLLDTDGYCDPRSGTPMFATASVRLRDDVVELAESLGGSCRVRTLNPGKGGYPTSRQDFWEVRIRLPEGVGVPFALGRKAQLYRAGDGLGLVRTVRSVDYVGDKEVRCITVAAPDHLYVTERHLLTHNCFGLYQEGSVLMSSYLDKHGLSEQVRAESGDDELTANPTMLVVQLPSWGLYEDWERAPALVGVRFKRPIQPGPTHESQLRRKLRNPDKFKVEREAQWADVSGAYFDPDVVERMFVPPSWRDPLEPQSRGFLDRRYRIHCDPGRTGANFALCAGHLEDAPPDEHGNVWPHVIIDLLHVWRPQDFPADVETGRPTIDYVKVQEDIDDLLFRFPSTAKISFDQWNSAGMIAALRRKYSPGIRVAEVTFTEKDNQARFERVKSALNLGWVKSYRDHFHDDDNSLLEMELRFLSEKNGRVVKQDVGPVTTKDLCDAFCVVVSDLLHDSLERYGSADDLATGVFGSTNVSGLRAGREQERMVAAGVNSERGLENRARLAGWREERARSRYAPDRLSSIHRRR